VSPLAEQTDSLRVRDVSDCYRVLARAGDFSHAYVILERSSTRSRKPVPPFPSSLRHHVSPGAEQIVNLMLSRCQRLSQGFGAHRGYFSNGVLFSPWKRALAYLAPRSSTAWAPRLRTRNAQRRNGQSIMRCITGGAAANRLGTPIKYLQRATSGAAGNGLSRCQGLPMCPFTTCALHSFFCVRASLANKQNSITGGWGLGAQCLCVEPELSPCVHL
jgi:hypothetical protein